MNKKKLAYKFLFICNNTDQAIAIQLFFFQTCVSSTLTGLQPGEVMSIFCSQPCLVVEYTKFWKKSADTYLPTMMLIPAIDQFATEYAVTLPYIEVRYRNEHFLQVRKSPGLSELSPSDHH